MTISVTVNLFDSFITITKTVDIIIQIRHSYGIILLNYYISHKNTAVDIYPNRMRSINPINLIFTLAYTY